MQIRLHFGKIAKATLQVLLGLGLHAQAVLVRESAKSLLARSRSDTVVKLDDQRLFVCIRFAHFMRRTKAIGTSCRLLQRLLAVST